MSKEVAKAGNTNISTEVYDYGDMAHKGFEGTTVSDLSIPFIAVLQPLSPEVSEQTIENARAGDLFNTVTKEIVKQPLRVIPLYREESWVRWAPNRGGLKGRFETDSKEVKSIIDSNGGTRIPPKGSDGKTIPFKDSEGNDVIETHYVYCLIIDEDLETVEGYCVLPFSSTKIKVYRDWMTALFTQKGKPPIFANRASISTMKQTGNGNTWFNYSIGPAKNSWRESLIPPTNRDLLEEAKNFREMIESGLAKADFTSMEESGSDSDSSGESSNGEVPEGKTPF